MNFRNNGFLRFSVKWLLLSAFLINVLNAAQHKFYIGANVGMVGFSAKTSDEVSNNFPELQKLYIDKSIRSKSVLGGIFIGYILRMQNFGIGTEVSWQYTNLEKTLDGKFEHPANGDRLQFTIKNKITSQTEFILKPGYFIYNYFTYVILGFNLQNMRYDYNAAGRVAGGAAVRSFYGRKSRHVRGYTFGVGVQKNVYENIALGLEFRFSKFPERSYQFDLPNNISEIKLSSKLKDIQTYSASLRFMYTF